MSSRAGHDHEPPGRRQEAPFVVHCEAGKYACCACGASQRYPYCDGTHRDLEGDAKPRKVILDSARRVAWCACGRSADAPFCDGSHARGSVDSGGGDSDGGDSGGGDSDGGSASVDRDGR